MGTHSQTLKLAPGSVAAYLIKTVDDWTGPSGPNQLQTPTAFVVRTLDETPPYFMPSYPAVTRIFRAAARVAFELNEGGNVYFVAFPKDAEVKPTAEELFALSVQPRYNIAPASKGIVSVSVGEEQIVANVTGLHGLTEYRLWAIAQDNAGNRMAAPAVLDFETLDNQAPSLTAEVLETGSSNVTISVELDEPGTVFFDVKPVGDGGQCPAVTSIKAQAEAANVKGVGSFNVPSADSRTIRCALMCLTPNIHLCTLSSCS